jgi:hypothetical protein
MTDAYVNPHLMPSKFASSRSKLLRPSPGDGLKELPPSPIWF